MLSRLTGEAGDAIGRPLLLELRLPQRGHCECSEAISKYISLRFQYPPRDCFVAYGSSQWHVVSPCFESFFRDPTLVHDGLVNQSLCQEPVMLSIFRRSHHKSRNKVFGGIDLNMKLGSNLYYLLKCRICPYPHKGLASRSGIVLESFSCWNRMT